MPPLQVSSPAIFDVGEDSNIGNNKKATRLGRFFCLKQNNKLKLQIGKEVYIFQKPLISIYI